MGAGVTPKFVVVLLLALSGFARSERAQTYEGTHSPHGKLALPCQNCHTSNGWRPIRAVPEFDHSQTRYPLRGMHTAVACSSCHVKMVFSNAGQRCQDCHADIHRRQLGANCEQCHTVRGWQVAVKDVEQHNNRFPLTGAHAAVDCNACHKSGANSKFQIMSTACDSCHLKDFTSTTNPSHVKAQFSTSCENCHTTDNWLNAKITGFDHSTTGFVLSGGHAVPPRQCADCHLNNNYTLGAMPCFGCHQKDFASATAPVPHSGFPNTCETCHDTVQWSDAKFDHSTTGFALTGLHTVPPRQCSDCHVNNNYTLNSTACVTCHLKDFQGATSPNHATANFPQTCEQCHNTSNWMDAKFNHDSTGFSLTGLHTVPPRACTDCHFNNNYTLSNAACVSCHLKDFQEATSPNHATANFPQTCEQCHNTSNWMDAKFNHDSTGFSLTGLHTVPPRQCSDCHVNNNYTLNSTACVTCHLKDYQGTTSPNHVDSNFPETCEQCHGTSTWLNATFNHDSTGFPLTGLHTVPPRACTDCHVNNNYNLNSTACVTCHLKDYQGTTNPNHVTANFPQTCNQCHDTSNWTNATFNHDSTGFSLTGLHTVPPRACTDCHVNNNYSLNTAACVSCHLNDFQGTTNPNHVTANFPQTCAQCHGTSTWLNATFNHDSTGFPLTGLHTVPPRACTDCHVNNNYNLNSTACVTCHLKDYQGTTNPNHVAQGFSQTCDTCHNTGAWQPAQFDHSKSGFPLTGSHTVPPRTCTDCHVNNNYNITVMTCISCHQTDFNNATSPVPHLGFPTTCQQCHDTVQWTDGKFDHSTTGFTLTGMHTVPPRTCTDCHVNNNYSLNSTACVTCHLKDYQGTTNPNHATANFPQTCDTCHDTTNWMDATFNHASTGFTLTGLHTVPPRACTDCHVNNNYNLNSTACATCHLKDYQGTTNPNHVTANFPQTCEQCHGTSTWLNATFNHDSTGFPLTGLHTVPPRACTDCHVNNNYNLTSTACVTCHLKDYQGTTNPNHVTANFPQTCAQCHGTSTWLNATFNHDSTGFSLTGLHTVPPRACTDCHVNNNYSLNSTACVTCHLKDYQGTTNPNHVSANFPQTCNQCHDTSNWMNATFNHNSTGFPLTGLHTVPPRACTDCHVNNNYNLTSTACVTCHLKDYQGTTNPNHVTANFPQTCDTCHDTTNWMDATFNHASTGFALTGLHTVPPRQCTDCHVSNNYSLNSAACVTCHLKDYQGTTNPNHVTANFPQTCNQCHDTSNWMNATFNHSSTGFPLTGMHTVPPRACTDCHVNNNYSLNSTACVTCHLKDYQGTTNPNHVTANFPQTCDTCHDTTNWMDATFNHSSTGFPLTGLHTVP
ncbi:MAG TPA: hypothetical protein VMG82_21485, partial [Candidatus Sulfotelmatobacter sp.]|nr:hypothetical protein [Candidatus Sulfotelmatobacter sp.]